MEKKSWERHGHSEAACLLSGAGKYQISMGERMERSGINEVISPSFPPQRAIAIPHTPLKLGLWDSLNQIAQCCIYYVATFIEGKTFNFVTVATKTNMYIDTYTSQSPLCHIRFECIKCLTTA